MVIGTKEYYFEALETHVNSFFDKFLGELLDEKMLALIKYDLCGFLLDMCENGCLRYPSRAEMSDLVSRNIHGVDGCINIDVCKLSSVLSFWWVSW